MDTRKTHIGRGGGRGQSQDAVDLPKERVKHRASKLFSNRPAETKVDREKQRKEGITKE